MHTEQTLQKMKSLKLTHMAQSLEDRLSRGEHHKVDPETFVARLVDDEAEGRATKRLQGLIRRASVRPEKAALENIRYAPDRGFAKKDLERYYRNDWIDRHENMVFTGATGTGKTYLAEALILQACKLGYKAKKISMDMLFEEIRVHRAMGKYAKFMKDSSSTSVLVIDDFAIGNHDGVQYCELLHLLEERVGKCSTIITSQYPTELWHERIPDPTIADAICDRLLMTSWVLELKGDSQRGKPHE